MIGILAVLASLLAAWMSGTPLSEPRSEVAAAPLGGRIVVVGGFLSSGANSRRVDAHGVVRVDAPRVRAVREEPADDDDPPAERGRRDLAPRLGQRRPADPGREQRPSYSL